MVKLNEGLNGKEAKSDVYLEMMDETWVGISVKAQKNATKTNYSVEKILPNGKELSKIRTPELRFISLKRPKKLLQPSP